MEPIEQKPKILVVDDEPTNLKLLREILRKDYDLIFARNGHEMLQHAGASPDLILLDVMMPDMDGYEGCQRLQENPMTRDIPVIFVTAKIEMADELRGLEVGAVDYITKPVQGPIVHARIKTHLALRQAREVIAQQHREIQKQNEELRRAVQLRDDVEQIVRHDLKGPLNAIIGMPGVIVDDENLNDTQRQCLRIIEKSGFRLLGMVNLSHDLYKMEQGIYKIAARPVDILAVLHNITTELADLIRGKKITLTLSLNGKPTVAGDTFMVVGEELLYHSMLCNLLKNALEASPNGGPVLVSLEQGTPSVLDLRNKGSVPEEIRQRFFDKYVTFGKTTGTGLGTYSAKLIATTSGCDISLDTSREGETAMVIRFP